jgi:hypothetical protein
MMQRPEQHMSPQSHGEHPDSDDALMQSGDDDEIETGLDDFQESGRGSKRKRPLSVS